MRRVIAHLITMVAGQSPGGSACVDFAGPLLACSGREQIPITAYAALDGSAHRTIGLRIIAHASSGTAEGVSNRVQ